jgi:RsiW-degrading membrane proteinase PrsW (M82 family)
MTAYAENLLLCIAAPLAVALLFVHGGARRFCGFFLAGMLVCLLAAYIDSFLMAMTDFSVDDAAIYLTPITEECMKLLPLLFYELVLEPDDPDLLAAAVAVGTGFATFENCCYLLAGDASQLTYVLVRGFAVGVMHTSGALAAGIGLTLMKRYRQMAGFVLLGILSAVVTYHAVYNLLVSVSGPPRWAGYGLPLAVTAAAAAWQRKKKAP